MSDPEEVELTTPAEDPAQAEADNIVAEAAKTIQEQQPSINIFDHELAINFTQSILFPQSQE